MSAGTVRVNLDLRKLRRHLGTDLALQTQLLAVATAVESAGRQLSPIGKSSVRSGYFKRHWYVRRYRDYYRVGNNDPFAHLVEFGSSKNSAYSPTRLAMAFIAGRSPNIRVTYTPKATGDDE